MCFFVANNFVFSQFSIKCLHPKKMENCCLHISVIASGLASLFFAEKTRGKKIWGTGNLIVGTRTTKNNTTYIYLYIYTHMYSIYIIYIYVLYIYIYMYTRIWGTSGMRPLASVSFCDTDSISRCISQVSIFNHRFQVTNPSLSFNRSSSSSRWLYGVDLIIVNCKLEAKLGIFCSKRYRNFVVEEKFRFQKKNIGLWVFSGTWIQLHVSKSSLLSSFSLFRMEINFLEPQPRHIQVVPSQTPQKALFGKRKMDIPNVAYWRNIPKACNSKK